MKRHENNERRFKGVKGDTAGPGQYDPKVIVPERNKALQWEKD